MQKKELRVLHVTSGLGLGGAERILLSAAIEGRRRGYIPLVVSLRSGGETRLVLEQNDIEVIELDSPATYPSPRVLYRLTKIIRQFDPHLIKSWMYHGNIIALAAVALSSSASARQLVWGVYNSALDLSQYSWRMRAVVRAGAWFSGKPAGIAYNSRRAKVDHQRLGYNSQSEALIQNGIDFDIFRPVPGARARVRKELGLSTSEKVAIIVARVDPQKDWKTVLSGVSKVDGLVTVCVGPTTVQLPDQPGLIKLGAHLDMCELYSIADVFLLPSAFGEGTSVAMCEAMACGIPVVVTDVGDNAIYAKDGGFVVPARDPQALADAIDKVVNASQAQRKALGKQALTTARQHFSMEKSFEDLFSIWDDLLSANSKVA